MAPKRPLVSTAVRTEFGEVLDDPSFYDVSGSDRDLTFVPGFSDMRRDRDLKIAEVASGKRNHWETNIAPLPVNCRWTRVTDVKGAPDSRKQIAAGNLGYRVVNQKDVGEHDWLKELPPGATIAADGSIRKGDTMLMVTDGKTAARNAARKAAQTRRMVSETAGAAGGLIDIGSRKEGVDPFVQQEAASAAGGK